MGMPDRFNDVGVQIEAWHLLEPGNVIMGKIVEIQPRRSGKYKGDLFVISVTNRCQVRDGDSSRRAREGELVAVDVKEGLKALEIHVGTDAEVYINPIEKGETQDGNAFWKFQLGATSVKGPKG